MLLSKHQEPQSYLAEQTVKQAMTVKLIRVLLLPEPFALTLKWWQVPQQEASHNFLFTLNTLTSTDVMGKVL